MSESLLTVLKFSPLCSVMVWPPFCEGCGVGKGGNVTWVPGLTEMNPENNPAASPVSSQVNLPGLFQTAHIKIHPPSVSPLCKSEGLAECSRVRSTPFSVPRPAFKGFEVHEVFFLREKRNLSCCRGCSVVSKLGTWPSVFSTQVQPLPSTDKKYLLCAKLLGPKRVVGYLGGSQWSVWKKMGFALVVGPCGVNCNLSYASAAECFPACDPKNGFCEDDNVCR